MDAIIEKIPGGLRVDGFELRNGKCGCTTVLPCCYSWSRVKRSGEAIQFAAKSTGPESKNLFSWGYTVRKGNVTIQAFFEDARDKKIFSGYYPPKLENLLAGGWELVSKDGEREDFGLWRCAACRWLYKSQEQENGFEQLPDDWTCPVCRTGKNSFEQVG